MTTLATTIVTEAGARALADALGDHPRFGERSIEAGEIEPDRWRVGVYFEEEPDAGDTAALARVLSEMAPEAATFTLETLPDIDWVAKSLEGLTPVRAGRFLIHGRHDRQRVTPGDLAIEIEANLAFGTGHHGTTAGCLMAIDRLAKERPIRRALDVGTGSGILAIAIARHAPAAKIVATDIDPVAVAIARTNMKLNGTARIATAVGGTLGLPAIRKSSPYDLIVANILAGPLVALAPSTCRNLAAGGTVILSGLLVDQKRRVAAAYIGQKLRLVRTIVIDGWATLVLAAPGARPRRRRDSGDAPTRN